MCEDIGFGFGGMVGFFESKSRAVEGGRDGFGGAVDEECAFAFVGFDAEFDRFDEGELDGFAGAEGLFGLEGCFGFSDALKLFVFVLRVLDVLKACLLDGLFHLCGSLGCWCGWRRLCAGLERPNKDKQEGKERSGLHGRCSLFGWGRVSEGMYEITSERKGAGDEEGGEEGVRGRRWIG